MVSPRVLVAGGGTGGHVFPMIAVADALKAQCPDIEQIFVGTGRGIETRVVPEAGYELRLLDVLPLRGGGFKGLVRGATRAMAIVPEARALVREFAPDVVFSVGGYAAGPVSLAARSLGVPVTLMEPNAVAGFTNRVLRPFICRAYVCFPETARSFAADVVRETGVPLRRRFAPAPYPAAGDSMKVLVMGGSQGAVALNETVPRALARAIEQGVAIEVLHQTGKGKDAAVIEEYDKLGIQKRVTITTFIDDVASALADADVVIERAGAGSLAELCAVGRPGLLIPYPYAADDHQRHNAESLERAGAARCVVQSDDAEQVLLDALMELGTDYSARAAMARASAERGRPDAAAEIARDILALAAEQQKGRHGTRKNRTNDEDELQAHRCVQKAEVTS